MAKLKVMVAVWPAPTTVLLLVMVSVGAWVSMLTAGPLAAACGLPATSVADALGRPTLTWPLTPVLALTTNRYHRPLVSGTGSRLTKLALVRAKSLPVRPTMGSLRATMKLAVFLFCVNTPVSTRVMATVGGVLSITRPMLWLALLPAWSVLVTRSW